MKDTTKVRKRAKKEAEPLAPVEVQALVPLEMPTPASRHRARIAAMRTPRPGVTSENKARFIELMLSGELPVDICDDDSMPRFAAYRAEMAADEAFGEAYAAAFAVMADMALEDAQRFARDATEAGNVDAARAADIYVKSLSSVLEKLSPAKYGVLVKHAGADGGALSVSVISYADVPPKPLA